MYFSRYLEVWLHLIISGDIFVFFDTIDNFAVKLYNLETLSVLKFCLFPFASFANIHPLSLMGKREGIRATLPYIFEKNYQLAKIPKIHF